MLLGVAYVMAVVALWGIGVALLVSHQLNGSSTFPQTTERMFHEQCRPRLWLLSDKRLLYLRHHGRLIREMKIRQRRSRIFRRDMNDLKSEFRSTCSVLKAVLVLSQCDRPDLASRLVRAQVAFFHGLMKMRFRLLRYQFGFR
ncbi:MAG TPA: hypothetical protein VKB88_00490 [Bryobacteraceae bacterium]|nr:hypothetical protein [Bryobacteraceae bacterium]